MAGGHLARRRRLRRSVKDYDECLAKWEQADMAAHGLIMSTLPEELMEDAGSTPLCPDLWAYLAESLHVLYQRVRGAARQPALHVRPR